MDFSINVTKLLWFKKTCCTCLSILIDRHHVSTEMCFFLPFCACETSMISEMDWACENSDDTLFGKCSNAANCDNIAEGLHATDDCGTIGQGGDWGCCLAPIREGPPGF